MSEIRFEMRKVTEKRKKRVGRRSIYDPMIDQFVESGSDLVEIDVEGRAPSYVVGMLKRRIKVRGLVIKATAVSDVVYLEKA